MRVGTHENDENAEDLEHKPPVARNARVVLEQFTLRAADVGGDVECVSVDPLDRLALLCNHVCELIEDLAKVRDRSLNRLDGSRARLYVTVLHDAIAGRSE
jgi:hypothetical protein